MTAVEIEDRQAQVLAEAWADLLSTEGGRMLAYDLMAEARVFGSTFATDAGLAAWQEGRRDMGLRVMRRVLDTDPTIFARMQIEAGNRDDQIERAKQQETETDDD